MPDPSHLQPLSSPKVPWDRCMLMAPPSTPSSRFASDVMAGVRAQAWVEEVVGKKLEGESFGETLKDGIGLCCLINKIRPGTIAKVETSKVPFKQMANISAFIHACKAFGVRESSLFETLDLYNERRLPQVARCLFSLSDIVRETMPEFPGPYLSPPDKPEADPVVMAVVDIARGRSPSPVWRTTSNKPGAAHSPKSTSRRQEGEKGVPVAEKSFNTNEATGNAIHNNRSRKTLNLTLPMPVEQTPAAAAVAECCLSPAAHAAGQLTYGIYEGGGVMATPRESRAALTEAEMPTPSRRPGGAPFAAGDRRDPGNDDTSSSSSGRGRQLRRPLSQEEQVRRRKQILAQLDAELEVALWIECLTSITFPGKFWSSLKDGVILCRVIDAIQPGLIPTVNTAHGPFPEMENIAAFLAACRALGVAEHSLFDTKDLHEKKDLQTVVRCINILGATVQSTVPSFQGPYLGKKSETCSTINARGLRNRLGKGPGAVGEIPVEGLGEGCRVTENTTPQNPPKNSSVHAEALKNEKKSAADGEATATVTPAESPSGTWQQQVTGVVEGSPTRSAAVDAASAKLELSQRSVSPARNHRQGLLARVAASPLRGAAASPLIRRRWRRNSPSPRQRGAGVAGAVSDTRPPVILEEVPLVEVTGAEHAGVHDEKNGQEKKEDNKKQATVGDGAEVQVLQQQRHRSSGCTDGEVERCVQTYSRDVFPDHKAEHVDDDWVDVVAQVQRFVESQTGMSWRVHADMYESLRDGWQLGLLANALRPGLIRRVHNSIMPGKHVHNIGNFLTACRMMGVASSLIFDVPDLYAQRNLIKVSRTLLALRSLSTGPDFGRSGRTSGLAGETSLSDSAAAFAAAAAATDGEGGTWSAKAR